MADEVRVSSMEYRVWGDADTGGGWQPQVAGLSDSGIDSVICPVGLLGRDAVPTHTRERSKRLAVGG